MQINKTHADLTRAESVQRTQQSSATQAPVSSLDAPAEVRRVDAVQISDTGRALAGTGAAPGDSEVSELDPQRADEIRARILSGAYNSVEMADQVARWIMRSGDL